MLTAPSRRPGDRDVRDGRCRRGRADGPGGPRRRELTLRVLDDLDLITVPALRRRIHAALGDRPDRLVLDLSACSFADCRAVQLLLETRAGAARQGTTLVLQDVSPPVRRLLELTGSAATLSGG